MTPETIDPIQKRKALWMRRTADGLSIFRAIAGPALGYYISTRRNFRKKPVAGAIAIISTTDFLDGRLAKKAHAIDPSQKKPRGAWLDQMADKAFVHGILGGFIVRSAKEGSAGKAAFLATNEVIQFGRDAIVTNMRKQAQERGINTSARQLGRLKTSITLAALTAYTLTCSSKECGQRQETAALAGIGISTGLAIASGIALVHELQDEIEGHDQPVVPLDLPSAPISDLHDTSLEF